MQGYTNKHVLQLFQSDFERRKGSTEKRNSARLEITGITIAHMDNPQIISTINMRHSVMRENMVNLYVWEDGHIASN